MINIQILDYVDNKLKVSTIWKFETRSYSNKVIIGGNDDEIIIDNWEEIDINNIKKSSKIKIDIDNTKFNVVNWKGDINIYNEDKISELKEKLQIILNIPVYKQHLFYVTDKVVPLCYDITGINVNIREIDNWQGNFVNNIPTIESVYNNRENLIVESYEEFRLVKNIVDVTDTLYLISLDSFFTDKSAIEPLLNDTYTKELIYYSFILKYYPMLSLETFVMYIKNEIDISDMYPMIHPPISSIYDKYKKETKIFKSIANVTDKNINSLNLIYGISDATILCQNNIKVNLRNLFDSFCCTETYPFIKCKTMIHRPVELIKTYKISTPFRDRYPDDSIIIGVIMSHNDVILYGNLIITSNGTYYVKISFRDDLYVDYAKMYLIVEQHINHLLSIINNYGKFVLSNNIQLVSKNLTKVTDITMSVYWKPKVWSKGIAKVITQEFDLLSESNITTIKNTGEYFFNKSMFRFNHRLIEDIVRHIPNYYSRYYDNKIYNKWSGLFNKNRIFRIVNRHSDIKFELMNVKEEEKDLAWSIIVKYMYNISELLEKIHNGKLIGSNGKTMYKIEANIISKSRNVDKETGLDVAKKLKKLKELDPELYDFKKSYNTKEVLSKKCQKPLQPLILTTEEYESLTPEQRNKVEIYHNFTTDKPAYYRCPNPTFPYIQYIVGVHPKNYCIPCCKKTQIKTHNANKTNIQKTCKEQYSYNDNEVTDDKRTRYVSHWGKDIDVNKLCYLPDDIIGRIFHGEINTAEDLCRVETDYYAVGVLQRNIGALYSCALILSLAPDDIMETCFNLLREYPNILYELHTDSSIMFSSVDNFIESYNAIWQGNASHTVNAMPWNNIIISLVCKTFDIYIIVFDISDNQGFIKIPGTLQDANDIYNGRIGYIVSKSSSDIDADPSNLLYYPIILCNRDIFYKNNVIEASIFTSESSHVLKICEIVNTSLQRNNYNNDGIDLLTLKKFITKHNYIVTTYYVNHKNNCYAVLINNSSNTSLIYVPLSLSYYRGTYTTHQSHTVHTKYKHLAKFISLFNKDKVIIEFTKIIYYNNKAIGLASDHNWYVDITIDEIKTNKELYSLPRMDMLFDPYVINQNLIIDKLDDNIMKEFNKSLYNKYIYQLTLSSFVSYWESIKNEQKRRLLISNMVLNNKKVDTLINELDPADQHKIKMMYNDYKDTKNKNKLYKNFNDASFEFDKKELHTIRTKKHSEVISYLRNLSSKLFIVKPYTDIKFPNIMITCQDNVGVKPGYCNNSKLIIPDNYIENFIELLANDILNPLTTNILGVRNSYDNIIDPYDFIQHPYNSIQVIYI